MLEVGECMSKKLKVAEDFIHHLFVHMNDLNQFVIFSGITLKQFFNAVSPPPNLLLLKHGYHNSLFNMHTQLDFVPKEDIGNFVKKMDDYSGDICWLDFLNEKDVNQLTPMEQANLLYLSHKKEPVNSAFSSILKNRYVYYSAKHEKSTKVYFRHLSDSELLISNVYNQLIKEKESNGSFWRRKSNVTIPKLDPESLKVYRDFAKEGALLSLYKMEKSNKGYGVEIRTLSDYDYPDEVWDDLNEILKGRYDELIQIT